MSPGGVAFSLHRNYTASAIIKQPLNFKNQISRGDFRNEKTYKIEVDCANCANLMEEAARKTAGVASATANFMTQKKIVEFATGRYLMKTF